MDDSGKRMDSSVIESGLRELNQDIHFDMGARLGIQHPFINDRQGVFYKGTHICSIDRGEVPEFKEFYVEEAVLPASTADADREDAAVRYQVVPRTTPGYIEMVESVVNGKRDDLLIRGDGELLAIQVFRVVKTRGRVKRVGWRHAFEAILRAKIPGITRSSLGAKFGVDMYRFPIGSMADVCAQLVAE